MTSSGGAGAMAAALGPRAGAEAERQRLHRAVTGLQARARGFLLRRRLRGLREEFEAVVLEIEGDLRGLRWTGGGVLQRPRFQSELSPGKPLDAGEAAENETIPKKTPEKPDPPGAEWAGGFGNIPPSAPLPSGTTPNSQKTPNLGSGAAESPGKEGGALEWDSDSSDLGASPEIPADLRGLTRWELQSHRNHLLMELLWIQQAIASRKHFLMLKQELGIPELSRSIPEFWDGCEALELQHQS